MSHKIYLTTQDITPINDQFTTGGGKNPEPTQIQVHSIEYEVCHAVDSMNGRIKANRIQKPIRFGIEAQAAVADLFQACAQGRNVASSKPWVFSFYVQDGDKSASTGDSNKTVYMTLTLSKEVFVKSVKLSVGDEAFNASQSSTLQGAQENSSLELIWVELSYQKIDFEIKGKSPKVASDDWALH